MGAANRGGQVSTFASHGVGVFKWLWVKNRYPKWVALVNGSMDQNL